MGSIRSREEAGVVARGAGWATEGLNQVCGHGDEGEAEMGAQGSEVS